MLDKRDEQLSTQTQQVACTVPFTPMHSKCSLTHSNQVLEPSHTAQVHTPSKQTRAEQEGGARQTTCK